MVGCVESACVGMATFGFVNLERGAADERPLWAPAGTTRLSHDGYTNMSGGITPRTCDGGGITPYMPNSPPCTHTPTGHTLSYTIV